MKLCGLLGKQCPRCALCLLDLYRSRWVWAPRKISASISIGRAMRAAMAADMPSRRARDAIGQAKRRPQRQRLPQGQTPASGPLNRSAIGVRRIESTAPKRSRRLRYVFLIEKIRREKLHRGNHPRSTPHRGNEELMSKFTGNRAAPINARELPANGGVKVTPHPAANNWKSPTPNPLGTEWHSPSPSSHPALVGSSANAAAMAGLGATPKRIG